LLTILKNVHVFAPEPLGLCHVLVGGNKILKVDTEAISLAGVEVIEGAGKRLIPGFIDGHAHLTGGGGEAGFKTRVPAPLLGQYTQAGVTTVVGLLGTDDTTRDTRSLVAQAYALREEGLGAYCYTGGYHLPPMTLTGSVRDDIIYLDPVIGVGEIAISDHRSSQPTLDEILRLASEAHVAGLISRKAGILHLHLGDGERGLELVREALSISEIPARVFNPTHVNRRKALFEEAISLAHRGITIDVTAYPVEDDVEAIQADEAIALYLAQGAPADRITVSSDGGGCLPVFDDQGVMTTMDVGQSAELLVTLDGLLAKGLDSFTHVYQ